MRYLGIVGRLAAVILTAAVAITGLFAATANAGTPAHRTWNSQKNPLEVTSHKTVGRTYGSFSVQTLSSGTRAIVQGYQQLRVHKSYKYKVYTRQETWSNSGYCVQSEYITCNMKYYKIASVDSPHMGKSDKRWHYFSTNTKTDPSADYARTVIFVRLDVPWRFDPQAGPSITAGIKY